MLNLLHASRAGLPPYMINPRVAGSTSVCKDHEWGLRSFLDPRVLNQRILIMLLIQDRQLSSWKRSCFKIIAAMAIERSVLKMRPNNRKWPMSWKKKNTVGGGRIAKRGMTVRKEKNGWWERDGWRSNMVRRGPTERISQWREIERWYWRSEIGETLV